MVPGRGLACLFFSCASASYLSHTHVPTPAGRCRAPRACSEDWRDVRARLVKQEQAEAMGAPEAEDGAPGGEEYVFATPLIEQGSVILGGTQQEFGFALRQQYFHKSVMLLLQHDEQFTKGIILNRPSALELDGWRVWFGGDVAEGGFFKGVAEAVGEREIVCLHSLESEEARRLSLQVIRGVSQTTLAGAQSLVASGAASKSDFWLFVGYAGWAPKQLEGEVELDSWFLAAADSAVLLRELLRQGTELPPPSESSTAGDGLATWERLMESIGKGDEVTRTRGSLEDRILKEWVRVNLLPRAPPADGGPLLPEKVEGLVLRSGHDGGSFTLGEQFMHKSLCLVLAGVPDGPCLGAVLNRPTANVVQFNLPSRPRRCIHFGGEARVKSGLDIDANGLLWLHHSADLGGAPIGDSGVYRIAASDAANLVKDGAAALDDFLLVAGIQAWSREALQALMARGDLVPVADGAALWDQIWALGGGGGGSDDAAQEASELSDGTALWWAATQQKASQTVGAVSSTQTLPSSRLADEALAQWLHFFAGHPERGEEPVGGA